MGNITKPRILPPDIDLMKRIAKHGFIDRDYVIRFAYPGVKERTKLDRIHQLIRWHYLIRECTFIPPDYSIYYRTGYQIIALGVRGLNLMREHGIEVSSNMQALKNSSPYRKYHQVQIASVCDTLVDSFLDKSKTNWQVEFILNEKEAFVDDAMNQPDAILVFKHNEKDARIAIFLEIERSYASEKSLDRKIKGYTYAFDNKIFDKLSGQVISRRVLFVAQTQHQLDALDAKLQKISINIPILLTGYTDITSDSHASIYKQPNKPDSIKLLGKL